ncbi:MAG: hypothetical protein WBE13_03995 [Candidatus Acidiferrum sp.]
MIETPPIPIRIYREFTKRDWPELPESAQDALAGFLIDLQKDPENPRIVGRAQRDAAGQIGFEFFPGFTVYWQIVRNELDPSGQPARIEVLALQKMGIEFSETSKNDLPEGEASKPEPPDSIDRVHSRNGRLGNLAMWGTLHVSRRTGRVKGWIVDSWSQGGHPHLQPKMHWVSFPDYKLHHMRLNIDFHSTIEVGPEDEDVDPVRLVFVHGTLKQWEQEWIEEESKKAS